MKKNYYSYKLEKGFILEIYPEIEKGEKIYNCFLYHPDYCVKSFLYGAALQGENFMQFVKTAKNYIDVYNCIEQYKFDYMY